jgi:hypothetical protein
MEAMERDNALRVARGVRPRRLSDEWTSRPRLRPHETVLWSDFLSFAAFCGGDPRPADLQAWFALRDVERGEQVWMAELFSALSAVVREREST